MKLELRPSYIFGKVVMSIDSEQESVAVAMDGDEGSGALTPSWDRLLTARELEEGFLDLSPASFPSSSGWKF